MDKTNPLMTSRYIIHGGLEKIKSPFQIRTIFVTEWDFYLVLFDKRCVGQLSKESDLELDISAKCVYDNLVRVCRKTVCVLNLDSLR